MILIFHFYLGENSIFYFYLFLCISSVYSHLMLADPGCRSWMLFARTGSWQLWGWSAVATGWYLPLLSSSQEALIPSIGKARKESWPVEIFTCTHWCACVCARTNMQTHFIPKHFSCFLHIQVITLALFIYTNSCIHLFQCFWNWQTERTD